MKYIFCFSVLLLILAAVSFRDYMLLARHQVPVGVDGYYYVVQVESLLNQKQLFYPTKFPLVIYLITFIAQFSGDTVFSVKIAGIFFYISLNLALFALITSLTANKWIGILGVAVSNVSVTHLYWLCEFINQLGGLSFALWGAVCLKSAFRQKIWWIPTIIAFIFAIFCHKSIVFIIVTFSALFFLFHFLSKFKSFKAYYLIAVIALGFLICIPWIVIIKPFFQLPDAITETVQTVPRMPIDFTNFEEKLVLLFLSPLGLFFFFKEHENQVEERLGFVIGVVSYFSLLFTLNPFLNHEEGIRTISQRLDLLAHLQIAILLSCVFYFFKDKKVFGVIAGSAIALLLLGNNVLPLGLDERYLKDREFLSNKLKVIRSHLPNDSLVIAPHGNQFLVTYATGINSQHFLPENIPNNLYLLLSQVPCQENDSIITVFKRSGECIYLLEQRQQLLVNSYDRDRILKVNPHLRTVPAEILKHMFVLKAN